MSLNSWAEKEKVSPPHRLPQVLQLARAGVTPVDERTGALLGTVGQLEES